MILFTGKSNILPVSQSRRTEVAQQILKCDLFSPTSSSSSILLYSRQRYVLGDNAMHQMAQSSVFLSGMGGLGIEIGRLCVTLL